MPDGEASRRLCASVDIPRKVYASWFLEDANGGNAAMGAQYEKLIGGASDVESVFRFGGLARNDLLEDTPTRSANSRVTGMRSAEVAERQFIFVRTRMWRRSGRLHGRRSEVARTCPCG